MEFGSFYEPISIVFGAILALFGTVLALWLTGISFNVVSFLGAIIGIGIVAKNGILMLDYGVGSGADMLRPLAVAVIGALAISVLLSLIATPTLYFLMRGGSAAR